MLDDWAAVADVLTLTITALILRLTVVRQVNNGFDSYGHLYFAKEVKEQKAGPFDEIALRVVGARHFSAPFLWHRIVALFPIDKVVCRQKWINSTIDAIFSVFIYCFAVWAWGDRYNAILMAVLYLLTPMWFSRMSIGPRIAEFTPRLASELIGNMFFIVTLLPAGLPLYLVLLLGAILSMIVILVSKFGLQVMLLVTPLVSLVSMNPVPLYSLILGVVFVVVVTRGKFLGVLNTHFQHLKWYFIKNLKGEMPVSTRNSIREIFEINGVSGFHLLATLIKRIVVMNSYTGILLKMPVLVAAFYLYGLALIQGGVDSEVTIAASPVIAAFVVFILINIPVFLPLGEAERYLNYVAFYVVAMAVLLADSSQETWIIWWLIAYGLSWWVIESIFLGDVMRKLKPSAIYDDEVISYLNDQKDKLVLLLYPYHAVGVWRVLLETGHWVIYPVVADKGNREWFEKHFGCKYPYSDLEKLDEMAECLGLNMLIANKKELSHRVGEDWSPSSLWYKVDVGDPYYLVYRRLSGRD